MKPIVPINGKTSQVANYTGANGEIVVNTQTGALNIHNGIVAGGLYTIYPGAGISLIATQVALSSANINFTGIGGTYNVLKLICNAVLPTTTGALAQLIVGTGSGPAYQTSNYYWSSLANNNSVDTAAGNAGSADTSIGTGMALTASVGSISAIEYTIYGPGDGNKIVVAYQQVGINSAGGFEQVTGGGVWNSNGPITALSFQMSTGNIAHGNFSLYGFNH